MDVFSLMFDEKDLQDAQELIKKIEENIRFIKVEYQKALKEYEILRNGDPTIYEELEPKYLQLLAKLKKTIEDSTNLWDKAIASIENLEECKKEKTEYFLTGVIWALDNLELDSEIKKNIIDLAKNLI